MVLQELSNYIEDLCRRHIKIKHGSKECHFVNLNDDKKQTGLAQRLHYPGVYFSTSGYRLQGNDTDVKRYHTCRLEVWYHAKDTGNYGEIELRLSQANEILCDILAQMIHDKRQRKVPVLKGISLDGVQVEDIMNASNALYGCQVDFIVPSSLCIADRLQNFADEGQFDATFTEAFD